MAAYQGGKALPIILGMRPPEGSRGIRINFDFSVATSYTENLSIDQLGLSSIQGVFIDNSNSSSLTSLLIYGTNQKLIVPAYCQGYFPVLFVGPNLNVLVSSAGNVPVPIQFLNFPVPLQIWATTDPGSIVGTITVDGTVSIASSKGAFTDRSGTIAAAGVSQTLMAANGSRKSLWIKNPATIASQGIAALEPLYVNFTSAAGATNGSWELLPGEYIQLNGTYVTTELISVYAATVNHRYVAKEM